MDMSSPPDLRAGALAGDCRAVHEMLGQVGSKWTMMVIVALRQQPRRFNELRRHIAGISQQILTRTLKALERDGMLTRTVTATTPPQVTYALTERGQSLSLSVKQLADWMAAHLRAIDESRATYDANS